ncbi:hypothetical protein [Paractinoplanes durhamensis]|uniref:Uncharacterized protein n=1 Tax=Paractinoplanes durhamensis TaxID=113563 RepID=A0ABQ3YXR7_9ACTN|nr:hypothetical protein [Actinoplanes durhamensis]GIE02393.1 hypothetical protein Adu01nite_37430 [Actinoplanes durhamensis]
MDLQTYAYAIFVSALETDSAPAPGEVRDAVAAALRRHSGAEGCVAAAAFAFGDHPQAAAHRMSWALALAHRTPAVADRAPGRQRALPVEASIAVMLINDQFPRAMPAALLIYLMLLLPLGRIRGIPRRMYDSGTARE